MRGLACRTLAAAVAAWAAIPASHAIAQSWPSQPIRIIVGFAPGAAPDLIGRVAADALGQQLGGSALVENKVGAGGNIAVDAVAKAEPDGHTLGVSIGGALIVNPMIQTTPYDTARDIAMVTTLATQPSVLVVSARFPAASVAELVTLLKTEPGKHNYASIGVGSISHLAMELIKLQTGTDVVHVPFKGSPEAVLAITTNNAQMGALPIVAVKALADAGELKMLAVTSPQRWPETPNVPTFADAGFPAVQAEAWTAMIAPAKTPPAILAKVQAALKTAFARPEMLERLKKMSFQPVTNTPAEATALIRSETERWSVVVDKLGLRKK